MGRRNFSLRLNNELSDFDRIQFEWMLKSLGH